MSRSFDDFKSAVTDIRAFTRVGLEFTKQGYERTYTEAEEEANRLWQERSEYEAEPDHPFDIAISKVDGLLPDDLEKMLLAGAVKDAVTIYEVYLEEALNEAVAPYGWQITPSLDTLKWREVTLLFGAIFALPLSTPGVEHVRGLRHVLTHRRGRLRTQPERAAYGKSPDPMSFDNYAAHLTAGGVNESITVLSNSVRAIDPYVWDAAWGPGKGSLREVIERAIAANGKVQRLLSEPS